MRKCLFLLLLAHGQLFAQHASIHRLDGTEITTDSIDAIVDRLARASGTDGIAISILNRNDVVYRQAYGYRNAQEHTPLDTADVMYAASFSKAAFAFITMHLVQDGLLDLDRPLASYAGGSIGTLEGYEALAKDPRTASITARICLSHTTGLQNIWWMNPRDGSIDTVTGLKLFFDPGTRYAYSGEGLKLLQKVEEKITGQSLQQLAEKYLFTPAGMYRTGYVWDKSFEPVAAYGHDEKGKARGPQRSGRPGAAGSMNTTISDYGRFISYVLHGGGLRPDLLKLMLRPQVAIHSVQQFPTLFMETTHENDGIQLSYGLGWGLIQTPYGKAFFKEGHHDFWRNYNVNFPEKGIAVIIMSNSANAEGIFKELLEKLIGDVFTPWKWEGYIPYNEVGAG